MISRRVLDLLATNHVPFDIIRHPTTFTAQRTAEVTHIPGNMLAKTVLVMVEGDMKMFVLSANHKLDMKTLRDIFNTPNVRLAEESDFSKRFPDCEVGGMPPFGNLYGIDVYVSRELTKDDEIFFNAGDHSELIKMKYSDYAALVHPHIMGLVQ